MMFILDAVRLAFTVELVGIPYQATFSDITSDEAQQVIGQIRPGLISQFNTGSFPFTLASVDVVALRQVSMRCIYKKKIYIYSQCLNARI